MSSSLRTLLLIGLFLFTVSAGDPSARDRGDWNNINQVIGRPVEVHYAYGELTVITDNVIVGFDKDHIDIAAGLYSYNTYRKENIRAVVLKRKVIVRILSLFLLSGDKVIYLSPGYRLNS